ncbi:MAG: tRNA (adenosine(37)-N6)-threonylcarbamoyltransferase complex dimerization subunit type 1 TsaB [Methylocystaceae bacterium]
MPLLAIDGATPVASAALIDGGVIKGEIYNQQGTGHAQTLMVMVDQLLEMTETTLQDLQVLAVTAGPGSFTGLRIGLATAQGLAMALSLPLIAVSTLEVLAAPLALTPALLVPVLNARKGEVYTRVYSGGLDGITPIGNEKAAAPEALCSEIRELSAATGHSMVALTGDGVQPYQEIWERELGDMLVPVPAYQARPRAGVLADLAARLFEQGRFIDPLDVRPSYLRLSEAETRLQCS